MGDVGGKLIARHAQRGTVRRQFEPWAICAPRCFRRMDLLSMRRCLGEGEYAEYETTARVDFATPLKPRQKEKQKLVRIDTFKHAKNTRPTERPQDENSMWNLHPRHQDDHGRRCLETTTQTEYMKGLTAKQDPLMPASGALQCRGGHEKAKTNFNVFPFGHAKNNFITTPGFRSTFARDAPLTGSPSQIRTETDEQKRFARQYFFTGMARRAGARVFYDEKPVEEK